MDNKELHEIVKGIDIKVSERVTLKMFCFALALIAGVLGGNCMLILNISKDIAIVSTQQNMIIRSFALNSNCEPPGCKVVVADKN